MDLTALRYTRIFVCMYRNRGNGRGGYIQPYNSDHLYITHVRGLDRLTMILDPQISMFHKRFKEEIQVYEQRNCSDRIPTSARVGFAYFCVAE